MLLQEPATTFGKPKASRPERYYPEVALSKNKFRPALMQKAVRATHDTTMRKRGRKAERVEVELTEVKAKSKETSLKPKSKERSNPRARKGPTGSRDEELNLWTAADDDEGEVPAMGKRRLSSSSDTYNFLDSPTSLYRKPQKPASILPLPQRAPANVRKSFQLNSGAGKSPKSLANKYLDVYTS